MDTMLMAVTVLSLAMVAAMAMVLGRMLREERRRSDARVALLTELASEPVVRRASADTMANTVADLELRAATPAVDTPPLFHEHEPSPAWPRRLAVVGAMAVLATIVVFGWSAITGDVPSRSITSASAAAQPLELLSLSHTQEAGSITISGLVQNPRGGRSLSRVDATVLVFGSDGRLQATGRAPLEIVTLAPGTESPFVIRVPVTGAPARYRVAFRGDDDRALGHVDRRDPDAIARKQEP
jgi:hypothetical protein